MLSYLRGMQVIMKGQVMIILILYLSKEIQEFDLINQLKQTILSKYQGSNNYHLILSPHHFRKLEHVEVKLVNIFQL